MGLFCCTKQYYRDFDTGKPKADAEVRAGRRQKTDFRGMLGSEGAVGTRANRRCRKLLSGGPAR